MKVEVKQVEKKFEPIELVITIESEEDVKLLYSLFNVSVKKVIDNSLDSAYNEMKISSSDCKMIYPLWREINNIAKSLNLKK
jgi:hypothetical protein